MTGLDPTDPASFERIEALIDRIRPDWAGDPNILGITPVLKVRASTVDPENLVLGFHVRDKVAPDRLADLGSRPVPDEIEGLPTDVILARQRALGSVDEKATRSAMFDTLIGGIAVGNANMNAYGTLGMTLLAQSDGRMVGITNEHVLVFDVDGHVGDEVQQPRFYLNSEVSLDDASCCPGGVLHYRGVDNVVVDVAAAVFAAAAIAAAASDEIDPHRRGQDATVPDPGERTVRETVAMAIDYPELPLPGTPYKVGVDWTYQRHTDARALGHSVSEEKRNPHVIDVQHLLTDKATYFRGQTVTFLAVLGADAYSKRCDSYFVTAAALSPSHHRAYKVILRPFQALEVDGALKPITHGEPGHVVDGGQVRRCLDFRHQEGGERFNTARTIDGLRYDPEGKVARFVAGTGGAVALQLPEELVITLPTPAAAITVRLEVPEGEPVIVRAFSGDDEVERADHAPANVTRDVTLRVEAPGIDRVVIDGRRGSWLQEVCMESSAQGCLYRGTLNLAPDEELGRWSTYLFAQTRNDVAVGIDPLVAAQTIGGLPATHNFFFAGDSDNITYGHTCNIDIASDGSFEVATPAPSVIG